MKVADELLQGPSEEYGKFLALQRVYGTANSYVRGRAVALKALEAQISRARRAGASESEILGKIRQGISDPPNAHPLCVK